MTFSSPRKSPIFLLQDEWQFFSRKNLLYFVIFSMQENPFSFAELTRSCENPLLGNKIQAQLADLGDLSAPEQNHEGR